MVLSTCISQLLEKLNEEINAIESEDEDVFVKVDRGIAISKNALCCAKALITNTNFKTDIEEIEFFKNQKPKILSILLYYNDLGRIEKKRPVGHTHRQKNYLSGDGSVVKVVRFL